MRTKRTVFLIWCLSLIGIIGNAQNPVVYSGNQLPENAGWNKLKFDNTLREDVGTPVTVATQSNALKLTAVNDGLAGYYKQLGYYKTNLGFNMSKGYTVEIKAKVSNSNGSFNIQGFDASGKGFRLVFYPNKVTEATGGLLQTTLNTDSNSDAFHTYRIAVSPDDKVHVYRDGALIGSFPIKTWAGDNIIIDGDFESGAPMADTGWMQGNDGNGTLSISNNPAHVHSGTYGLFADGGKHVYNEVPLKQGASYDMSFWGKTIQYNEGEWRDVNGWVEPAHEKIMYGVMDKNDPDWKHYSGYRWDAVGDAKNFNIELWVREDAGMGGNKSAFDDFLLAERVTPSIIPAGVANLFPNGDFENPNFDYFPSGDLRNNINLVYQAETNEAPDWHPFWGARVRLQYSKQVGNDEAGPYFARSGKYSLRYFNCFGNDAQYGEDATLPDDDRGKNSHLNTQPIELGVGKTYTFSFWYHFAKYGGDHLILVVKNGDNELFRKTVDNSIFPSWRNETLTFTTDAQNHALKILTERDGSTPGVLYMDDLCLFEGEPIQYDNTYLFFGKPTGVDGVNVEIESVMYDNTGAYAPNGEVFSSAYEKKTAPLMTTWGENLQATDPLFNEYPRPQLQRDSWVNLNGIWKFLRKETKTGFGEYIANDSYRKEILVPYPVESALSGVMDGNYDNMNKTYTYKRTFTINPAHAGKRIILHFGAVDWESYVFVNGTQVAHHVGGYDPFSADITDALTGSGEQELVVQIYDPTKGGNPRGKQDPMPGGIWYTPSSGIWQTVWYEAVDPTYITDLSLIPVNNNALKIRVDVANASGATAEVTILDGITQVATQTVTIGQEVSIPVSNAKLWSPDSPFLYGISISVKKGSAEVDKVSSYFGMRKIEKKMLRGKPYMFLNDEPVFNYGTLDQGFWPDGLHTAPTYDALRFDLNETKKLGMNMVRKHIKVEPARWFHYCDSIGLMVWQDIPTPAGLLSQRVVGDGSDNAVKDNFLRETEAIVKSLKNYPSIVMWVPYNESWGQFAGSDDPAKGDPSHTINGVNLIRSLDNTRLINPASGWTSYEIGDVLDKHNYSEPGLHTNKYNERIAVCGETGGYGFTIDGHIWSKAGNPYISISTAQELADEYKKFNSRAYALSNEGINGIVYTQITDIEEEVNGFFTYDRKVNKLALNDSVAGKVLKEGIKWMKSNVMVPILKTSTQGGELWKYVTGDEDFTNPGTGWNTQANFNDNTWSEGLSGFGSEGFSANTPWTNQSIFLRKIVAMPDLAEADRDGLKFTIFYDEDYELFINGVLAASNNGYITSYQDLKISDGAKAAIVWGGDNLFAIHVIQTGGGQFIDLGAYTEKNAFPLEYEPATKPVVWTEISNAEEFKAIKNNLSGFYKLVADIDLFFEYGYQPIGSSNAPFTGYINGNGHTVTCPEISGTNSNNQGLFGYAAGAYFTDLQLDQMLVTSTGADIGALLGRGAGVTVERVAVKNPQVTGRDHVGGLIGGTSSGKASRIKDCYVENGTISSTDWQAGGLLGVTSDTRIENSYFTGTVELPDVNADNRDGAGITSRIEAGINSLRGVVSLASIVKSGSGNEFISYGSDGVRLNEFINCYTRNDMVLDNLYDPNRGNQLPRATDAQKRPLSNFQTADLYVSIGWDFNNVWKMSTNATFPYPVFRAAGETGISSVNADANENNLSAYSVDDKLVIEVKKPAAVWIYDISGKLVNRLDVETSEQLSLSHGIYLIKSVCDRKVEAIKVVLK